ncbi:hypothetical protein F5Y18DRAFT_442759 [Xylariaceae sp. FL1019]|nr:hypothetical protein F5Y18DRAFT_442759 [Xylariaceae sp. FL1019]
MPLPGCSNTNHGITLDLGLLNEIKLDDHLVSISAGVTWGAVNELGYAAGLGVVGGRSGTGGIGGLALSGGLSVFSFREGFICDNIEFEVGVDICLFADEKLHSLTSKLVWRRGLWRSHYS